MRVWWDGPNLQISEGDKIEILRGIKENSSIRASTIRNITRGSTYRSRIEGTIMTRMPADITPPIRGYVKNIEFGVNVSFILEERGPPIVSGVLRECKRFLDPKLYERCKGKDYHDVVTNAFPILEDRIRAKIGVDPSYSGKKLIDYACKPNTGKLILGKTGSEQESFYFLFRGANGFLRNPQAHRIDEEMEESNIEAFEIICMVDLLLRLVEKAELRNK